MTRDHELARLRRLALQGDPEARDRLLRDARRRGDSAAALDTLLGPSPTPSPMAFLDLCRLLEHFEGGDIEHLIELADARLATWPVHTRPAPLDWLVALSEERVHPGLALARTLNLWGWPLPARMRGGGAPALLAHPALVHLTALWLEDDLRSLLGWPSEAGQRRMCEIEHLHVTSDIYGVHAIVLALARHPRALRSLSISARWHDVDFGQHWASLATSCPDLEALALVNCDLSDDAVRSLARAPLLRQLRRLSLRGNALTQASVRTLARSRYRPRELALDVRGQTTGALTEPDTLAPLARAVALEARCGPSPQPPDARLLDGAAVSTTHRRLVLRQARTLKLGAWVLDEAGTREVVEHLTPGRLETLMINGKSLLDPVAELLATAPSLSGLCTLDLDLVSPSSAAVASLLESSTLTSLRTLKVHCGELDAAVLSGPTPVTEHLEQLALTHMTLAAEVHTSLWSVPWPSLQVLDLSGCVLRGEPLEALVEAELPALRRVVLRHTALSAASMRRLASARWLSGLEGLELSGCPFGDVGALALATSERLGRLRRLSINHCNLTREGLESLMRSACLSPWCELEHRPHERIERDALLSDKARRALRLLDSLLRAELLELAGDEVDLRALAAALAPRLDALLHHRAPGPLLADWLLARDEIEDLFADDARLTAFVQASRHA